MSVTLFWATPQIREPTSKRKMAIRKTYLMEKKV
jgi:hypothetical protein